MYRVLERLRIAAKGRSHPENYSRMLTDTSNGCDLVYIRVPDLVELLRDYERLDIQARANHNQGMR